MRLTAAVETKSAHPLSRAVIEETNKRGLKIPESIEKFASLAGHGVEAVVEGHHVLIGTVKLMKDKGVEIEPMQADIDRLLSGRQSQVRQSCG